jgi:hypothetical protein
MLTPGPTGSDESDYGQAGVLDGIDPRRSNSAPPDRGKPVDVTGCPIYLGGEGRRFLTQPLRHRRAKVGQESVGQTTLNGVQRLSHREQQPSSRNLAWLDADLRILAQELGPPAVPIETVKGTKPAPAALDVEVLNCECLALPIRALLGGKLFDQIRAGSVQNPDQTAVELIGQLGWTGHQPGREDRAERAQILTGEVEGGLDGSGGMTNLESRIPQWI